MSAESAKKLEELVPPDVPRFTVVNPEQPMIGQGGWKSAFYYRQDQTGSLFVFKFLDPDELKKRIQEQAGMTDLEVMLAEALGGNTNSYPNLAYNTLEFLEDGTPYIREEPFPKNCTLEHRLRQRYRIGLEKSEAITIAQGMASALNNMHTKVKIRYIVPDADSPRGYSVREKVGVAHGDFKPGNIAIASEDRTIKVEDVKAFDYGLSSLGMTGKRNRGHIRYMAPELMVLKQEQEDKVAPGLTTQKDKQLSNDELEARQEKERQLKITADIYSYGVTLFETFTGRPLFHNLYQTDNGQFKKELLALYSNPKEWNKTIVEELNNHMIPEAFRSLIYRCVIHPHQEELRPIGRIVSALIPEKIRTIIGELSDEFFQTHARRTLDRLTYKRQERIKEGAELQDELEKTIVRYQETLPDAKRKRRRRTVLRAAAFVGIAGLVTYTGTVIDNLRDQNIATQEEAAQRMREDVVRLYLTTDDQGRPISGQRYGDGGHTNGECGELDGWIEELGSTIKGVTAYLDAVDREPLTVQAITRRYGKDVDERKFMETLLDLNSNLYDAVKRTTDTRSKHHVHDYDWEQRRETVPEIWQTTMQTAEEHIAELTESYVVKERSILNLDTRKRREFVSPTLGNLDTNDISNLRRQQAYILDELEQLTAESPEELRERLLKESGVYDKAIEQYVTEYKEAERDIRHYSNNTNNIVPIGIETNQIALDRAEKSAEHAMQVLEKLTRLDPNTIRTRIEEGYYHTE